MTADLPDDGSDDIAAAEAAAAAAQARAQEARAKAAELRRRLDITDDAAGAAAVTEAGELALRAATPKRRIRISRPQLAAALAVVATLALLAGTGYMLWQHRNAEEDRHRTAEFAAAGRQAAVNLMTMDYNAAKDVVQRLIDDSTGKFKANFQDTSGDLIKAMQETKVVTKVTVNDVAVESRTADSGVVMLAATTRREGPNATPADKQPRVWRVVVTLDRDGGVLKLSDVEFQ